MLSWRCFSAQASLLPISSFLLMSIFISFTDNFPSFYIPKWPVEFQLTSTSSLAPRKSDHYMPLFELFIRLGSLELLLLNPACIWQVSGCSPNTIPMFIIHILFESFSNVEVTVVNWLGTISLFQNLCKHFWLGRFTQQVVTVGFMTSCSLVNESLGVLGWKWSCQHGKVHWPYCLVLVCGVAPCFCMP